MSELRKLVLEVSRRCNLTCRTCTSEPLRGPVLDADGFRRRLEGLPETGRGIDLVRLVGEGESSLAPGFDEMLRAAAEACPSAEIEFFTNGMLLDETLARAIIGLGCPTIVTVSVDGATPEVFEHIRRGASFRRVVGNLERIRDIKRETGSPYPKVRINCNMLAHNLDDIPRVMSLAGRLGVEEVRYAQLVVHTRGEMARPDQHPFSVANRERTRERLLEARRISEALGVGIVATWPQVLGWTEAYADAGDLSAGLGVALTYEPCVWALSSLFVHLDGAAYPCCRRPVRLGDATAPGELGALFRSGPASELRGRLLGCEEVAACSGCIWYRRYAFRFEGREHWVSEAMFTDSLRIR